MKTLLSAMVFATIMLLGARADALVWRVYYNDAGRPTGFPKTAVIRAISETLREFESSVYNSNVVVRYEGETNQSHFQNDRRIVITWRPVPQDCARTCLSDFFHCGNGAVGPREIQLSNIFTYLDPITGQIVPGLNPRWRPSPNPTSSCQDLQSTLLHEFAHQFRNIDSDDDPGNGVFINTSSILSVTVPDVALRHLWNEDARPTATNRQYHSSTGPHLTSIRVQVQDSSSQQILSTVDIPNSRPHTPVAITMADGQTASTGSGLRQRNFAIAWGGRLFPDVSSVFVSQHTGGEAFWTMTISNTFGTMRRPCIAVSGQHQVVIFTGNAQIPDVQNFGQGWLAGLRNVFQSESHDGGFTWSSTQQINGVLTRNGVSCDVDPSSNRLVLVVQGADETIFTAFRDIAAVGSSAWTPFSQVSQPLSILGGGVARTREVPEIVFDRFQPGAGGLLAWMEDTTLFHTIGTIRFNGSRYELEDSAFVRGELTGIASHELLRTHPVMSFDSQPIFHLMTSSGTLMQAISQRTPIFSGSNFSSVSWTISPAPVSWYTGAAQNPSSFTTGTVQRMILDPS